MYSAPSTEEYGSETAPEKTEGTATWRLTSPALGVSGRVHEGCEFGGRLTVSLRSMMHGEKALLMLT
jgi:hypothetical protein